VSSPPTGTTVAIIGLGLMGSSFALALKQARPGAVIVGSDRDETVLHKAVARGMVESASSDLSVVAIADVVVVGTPLGSMRGLFAGLGGVTAGKVVTDMASTKVSVMEWAAAAGINLVGGHPMCGKEASGIDAADPTMYRGAAWVLTRADPTVMDLVEAVGARPVVIDPQTHSQVTVVAEWQQVLALLVFLVLDIHHLLIRALLASFHAAPPGTLVMTGATAHGAVALSADLFVIGVRIAAPVLIALLLTNGALGVLARTVPQLNVFVVGFPLNVGVGLVVLGASLPFTFRLLEARFAALEPALGALVQGLAHG